MPTKKQAPKNQQLAPLENVERRIHIIRGEKVMFDADLAELYGVETKALNRAVKRNPDRFPENFMFQLTKEESESLRFQIGTSNEGRGGRRYRPYVFTEHGALMLASVLNSPTAVAAGIQVVTAFVRLRNILAAHKDLARRIEEISRKTDESDKKTDTRFKAVFDLLDKLLNPSAKPKTQIGFRTTKK